MAYPNFYQGGYYPQYQNGAMPDMLNQYKGQYQQMPMQQPVQQMPTMAQPTPTNDLLFVLNETEAIAYPVAPNNSVTLWDKNKDTVYIKSVNMHGVPSMRILDYVERTADNAPKTLEKHECQCGKDFVRKEDFDALQNEINVLRSELEELKAKPKAKTAKKAVEEVEDNE